MKRFNKTLCKGLAKVAEVTHEWDLYIQPILWAYRVKELRITKQSSFKLVYGLELKLPMDLESGTQKKFGTSHLVGSSIVERLLEITDNISQLKVTAQRAIRKAQKQIKEKFGKYKLKYQIGDLVLYFDIAKTSQYHTKLENRWKRPY